MRDRAAGLTGESGAEPGLPVLGLDIGGVLVDRAHDDADTTFFGDRPMDTPAVEGCFPAVRHLTELFEHRVHIVSKAGQRARTLSTEWLRVHGLFEHVPRSNVWFVEKRPEKAPICEALRVTHFVDDRLDVLEHLVGVRHRIWFVGGSSVAPRATTPSWADRCDSWEQVVRIIETTLET